ncbi:MAG: LD-carboxypeptidase [Deltaproteobacteria bacterium]|nr:LD-carboxypeptidase [Deltaproteobacteria bacterium]MBW1951194.1 LD-carboxypeptidase [Deltaproteobacteria bacterium]MBW2009525.1 LD-carboxypeptidase [Deltaproteobacteria bacterium]MBW2103291.1 LD-carboxypeptidase [Deltaproteobacteria bacterium]MBW2349284.1 LD-carboxypeptidase [Deltaproteobacteria bacterium]
MATDLVRPRGLRPGDRVGIISPAGPVDTEALRPGILMLEEAGYEVVVGDYACGGDGYLAARDEQRLDDLHRMFADPGIAAVFCSRGGYGSFRILPEIRYEVMRRNPKIFVGYSDITALHAAVFKYAGLVTFHGPMVREFPVKSPENFQALLSLLRGERPDEFALTPGQVLVRGKARGPLLGGNLTTLCHLVGTPYMPRLDGCLLIVEERGEAAYRVDRLLTHLWVSGRLDKLAGLAAGMFLDCGPQEAVYEILESLGRRLGVPVVTGLPFGHGEENRALPLGVPAELDTYGGTLSITDAGVV